MSTTSIHKTGNCAYMNLMLSEVNVHVPKELNIGSDAECHQIGCLRSLQVASG